MKVLAIGVALALVAFRRASRRSPTQAGEQHGDPSTEAPGRTRSSWLAANMELTETEAKGVSARV